MGSYSSLWNKAKGTVAICAVISCGSLATASLLSSSAMAQEIMSMHNPRAAGIIGADDRHPLNWGRTTKLGSISVGRSYRFSTKNVVRLLNANKDFMCTGAVVGPTTVLTAGHCAYWKGDWRKGRPHELVFVEIWDGRLFVIDKMEKSKRFKAHPLPGHPLALPRKQYSVDMALVYTEKPVSFAVGGFLGITKYGGWTMGPSRGRSTPLFLIGFHSDVERHRPKLLVMEHCNGDFGRSGRVHHDCDSASGSSGSPLLTDAGNAYHIFGIHVAGGNGKEAIGIHLGSRENRALYQWVYERVKEDRLKYGYRLENWDYSDTGEERYLTGAFQGPDDVPWLR